MCRYLCKRISKCRRLQALEYSCLYRIRTMCQVPIDHCAKIWGYLIHRCTSIMTILRRKSLISTFLLLSFVAALSEICENWDLLLTRLVVVLERYTYVYNASSMSVYDVYRTYANPNGVCDIKFNDSTPVIATLGEKRGSVRISVRFSFSEALGRQAARDHAPGT